MARVLITGGAGFIGSHLARALVAQGHAVRALDNLSSGRWSNLGDARPDVACIEADVRDASAVAQALQGVDWVLHQAAMVSVVASMADPLACDAINAQATATLFELSRRAGVSRINFAASAAAYGDRPGLPKRECDPVAPLSPYASTKLYGELLCHVYTRSLGVPATPLRYFNVYGPRQDPNGPYAAVVSRFVDRMRQGRAPHIFGDGGQTRDFVYVGDVVRANLLALDIDAGACGSPVNIGTGRAVTLLDLVAALNEVFSSSLEPTFGPERPGDIRHSLADIGEAGRRLGYVPRTSLVDGLRALVEAG
jgi:UDP-glucose 4-epimerase